MSFGHRVFWNFLASFMETYWGRIRQLSASSPFCCHYPQAPPRLMSGQPARITGPSKIKRWLFSIQAIVTHPQTITPTTTTHSPLNLAPTTRALVLDALETCDPCLLPRCVSYIRQGFGSLTRDSASHVTICQPPPPPITANLIVPSSLHQDAHKQ